jgi:hypothetical protein
VVLAAVLSLAGLSAGARVPESREVSARLGLGSVLRQLAEEGDPVVLGQVDGSRQAGRILRVGADFVELAPAPGHVQGRVRGQASVVVPFSALAVVRPG